MLNFAENARVVIDPYLGIGVAKGHDVANHHHNLFISPREDDIMSQSAQKVQPPYDEHAMHDDEVLLKEDTEENGVISIHHAYVSSDKFLFCWWDQEVDSSNI